MNTHQRRSGERAKRRRIISTRSPVVAFALALSLLATACSSDPDPDSTSGQFVPSTSSDDGYEAAGSNSGGQPLVVTGLDDFDDADYTNEELEVLLDQQTTFDDVLEVPDPEPLEAGPPEAAIGKIDEQLEASAGTTSDRTPILDRVPALDEAPSGTIYGVRDGRRINEAGEANQLDETAALACGNIEIALTAIDDGLADKAADRIRTASRMAADTSVAAMNAWSPVLNSVAGEVATGASTTDASPLLAFLTTCTQGGYEL